MSFREKKFPTTIARDLAYLTLGEKLGHGAFRRVYVWLPNPKFVAKIEFDDGSFANIMEWEMWKRAKGTPLEKWLAPCDDISANGCVLLQHRTASTGTNPSRVPAIFKDRKWTNWGRYKGRMVCHDYGLIEYQQADIGNIQLESWET